MRSLSLPLLALLVACSSPPPVPSTPTATLATLATSPPAAAVVAASTPPLVRAAPTTTTTTLDPSFVEARLLEIEGSYDQAAQKWRALVRTSADVRYHLALSLALSGDGSAALQALTSGAPDPRDGYVRGLALESSGQHAQAMQALAQFATANAAVAPSVWLEIAERELNARRGREAADAAARGLDQAQTRPLKQRLLEVRAQALAALGDNESAFDAHRQVLALATNKNTLGEQLFHLAQVSRDLGKPDAALQALKTALDQFPSATTTADALRLLDELGAADQIDPFTLGRARYYAVDYRNAVNAFDQYLARDPNGPDVPAARLYRALASLTPGNEPAALAELDAMADDPDQDSDIAAQALLEAGQALEGLSEPDEAEIRYQHLLDRFPRLDAAAMAGFRLGLDRFQRGAFPEALAAWNGLIARRDDLQSEDVARVLYWRSRTFTSLRRADEAQAALVEAAAVRPASYYSLRAASALGQPNASDSDPSVSDADEQAFAQWLAARGEDLSSAYAVTSNDATLARAEAESAAGLYREANWEADELLQHYPDRPDRLYALSRRFTDLGLFGGAARLGSAAFSAASIETPLDAPAALLKRAYPRPFPNLTDAAATRYGIDPLLLDTTLQEASGFDTWLDNPASGARGLAAMSPVHADEVAHALHAPSEDLSPVSAIDRQAWFLADRLRRFEGRPEVALTTLGTPDRLVDTWAVRAAEPDAYIELIDYEGVRQGLRSLFATRLAYAATYGRPSGSPTTGDPLERISVGPEPTAAWIKISRLAGDVPPDAPVSSSPVDVGTPSEKDAFARGATLQRDGDYAAAASLFGDLASSSTPEVAQAAQLRLGQSLIAAGRPSEALTPLRSVSDPVATFLTGRALADTGHCSEAIPRFQQLAASGSDALGAYARVAEANCVADLGHAADAVPLLEGVASVGDVSRLQSLDFREKLALMRVRAGDIDGARADYQALLAGARSSSYRSELNYYLGVLSSEATFFRESVRLDPKGRAAQAGLDELVALSDGFVRSFEAGETRFAENRYREALASYTAFLQDSPADPRAAQALYGRGVSLVRLGQDRAGTAVLESIADHFPNTPEAADGLFRGGRIRESLSDLDGAAASYRRVLAMSASGARALDAQFRLAFVQFRQGALPQAAESWRSLSGTASAPDARAQAFFWLGKAHHAAGDEASARAAWSSASAADPRGFYGLRAADWLATGSSDVRADLAGRLPRVASRSDSDSEVGAALSQWISSRGGDAATARERLVADPGVARAETLLAVGLRQPAIWQLGAVESRLSDSLGAMALLGAWEQRHGLYNTALILGYDLAGAAHVSLTSGPAAIRQLLYPLPHPAVLAQAAQQLHVDPLLFSALMLQESLMDQSVESAAQARGLSQLIASTAYDAARALGQYSFHTSDLYQPKTSITLGAFTFGERLNRYNQQIFPALAAYNAAEFAVDGWLLSTAAYDVDTFAEAIPFTETYPYVQKIYENYNQYLELYGPPVSE